MAEAPSRAEWHPEPPTVVAARGLSDGETGRTVFISEATVKSHIRSIVAKLNRLVR